MVIPFAISLRFGIHWSRDERLMTKDKHMKCQDCRNEISIEHGSVKVGDVVDCHNCGAEYEIATLDPLKAELIEEEK